MGACDTAAPGLLGRLDGEALAGSSSVGTSTTCQPRVVQPLPRQQRDRRQRSGRPTKGNRWLGEVLIECAWAAARSRDSYLSAQFWRLARRIGKKKAAMAVGHSILVIAWHLLANDCDDACDDADLGGDFFVRRDSDRARQRRLPNSRPSATRSPSNPSPHDGDFLSG